MAFPKSYAFLVLTLFLGSLHVVLAMNYATFNSPDGNFMMHWTYDGNKLMFNITCKVTGWCAVGFSETADGAGMVNYDIAAGGVGDNGPYLADYWSTGLGSPPRDANQNLMRTGATQSGEYTSVAFERYAMTGDDSNDVQFGFDTEVFIIWAMAASDGTSATGSLSPQHSVRGRTQMKYNLIAKALAVKPLGMSLSSANGKFMMSWMYNGTKLVVNSTCQTTGWCAVGFTTTANGTGMVDYDIALGGVFDNMTEYLYDYWSSSKGRPPKDDQQNLMLIGASEANGFTSVQFARDAMTGDTNKDVQLAADTYVWVVWSMSMADVNSSTEFSVHNAQGIMPNKVNLLKGMVMMPTTTSPPTTTPSTTEATTTTKAAVDVVKSRAMFVAMLAAVVACWLSL